LVVPGGAAGREHEVANRVRGLGAQHVLPKPFKRDDLLAAVRSTLEMHPAAPYPC
jgi:DNA-binding response OmpR family regulator